MAALLTFAQLAAALPARAERPAASLEKSGEVKFDAEDYQGALADFTAAEEAAPSPRHQWFIGHSQDHLQHYRASVEAYVRFTTADPAKLGPRLIGRLAEAGERIAAIKAMPGTVHVETAPAAATLTVDGATRTGSSPFDLSLAPGPHALRASAPGFEAETMDLEVAYASKRTVSLALHEAAPVAPPAVAVAPAAAAPWPSESAPAPPPKPPITRHQLGWVAMGLAVVSAGFGTGFGIVAITSNDSYDHTPTLGRAYRAQDFAVYSDVTFGAAAALGVTGLVLLLGGDSDSPAPRTSASWTVRATPLTFAHGAGAGAAFTF